MNDIEKRLQKIEQRLDKLEGVENKKYDWEATNTYTVEELYAYKAPELVKIEGGEIGLVDQNYWIDLNRINTPRDLVEWVNHLLGKVWVTNEVLEQFISKVCFTKGWELYKGV